MDINICGHLTSLALLGGDTELADVAGGVVLTSVDLVRMTDRDKAMGVASSVAMDGAFAATIQVCSELRRRLGLLTEHLAWDCLLYMRLCIRDVTGPLLVSWHEDKSSRPVSVLVIGSNACRGSASRLRRWVQAWTTSKRTSRR